jgi:hypothetical protein
MSGVGPIGWALRDPRVGCSKSLTWPIRRSALRTSFDAWRSTSGLSKLPVAIAMEGFNGHARPLDALIRRRGYQLFNVNNLKLARFKEIFPGPAKSDPIDTRKILELFRLREYLPLAKDVREAGGGDAARE